MTNLIDMSVATHMDYLLFDVSTIFIIIVFNFFSPWEKPAAFYYLIVGLSINASLYLMMHYDINIAKTLEYWWFWALYAFWVYINDFLMALVLILNKDFLRLAKFINHNFSNKVVS
ncbi:hypothetical protein [Pseudoalteromonas sp. MMG010]|uniref:hypothetical protein n=1 Tax=Pseudoalteromonas sp. MMG010 TaxID=2822685 RepID=UPI001FFC8B26|nr:hypothetical protein [Pseudoalteromonas sp. MMG010]